MNLDKWSVWVASKMLTLECTNFKELSNKLGISISTLYYWIFGKKGKLVTPSGNSIVKMKKLFPNDDWEWLLS